MIDGFTVCGVDGSRLYSTKEPQDGELWRKAEKDGECIWHVDMVFLTYVGDCTRLMLGVEPILPGQGETTAATSLLEDAYFHYHYYCDIITFDALYGQRYNH